MSHMMEREGTETKRGIREIPLYEHFNKVFGSISTRCLAASEHFNKVFGSERSIRPDLRAQVFKMAVFAFRY